MNFTKNGYSYFIWLFYTVAVSIGLFCVVSFWGTSLGLSMPILIAASILILLFTAGVVYLLNRFTKGLGEALRNRKAVLVTLEVICAIMIFGLGIFFVFQMPESNVGEEYFNLSSVKDGERVPRLVHGATYLYIQLLHTVCVLFGNKLIVCNLVQLILYVVAVILVYTAVRRLAGVIPALITAGFLMIFAPLTLDSVKLSPNVLFLLLFSATWHMVISCIKSEEKAIILYLITGMTIGVILYLDVIGILLLLFMARKKLVSFGIGFSATLVSFFGCILVDALTCGKDYVSVLTAWCKLFMPEGFGLPISVYSGEAGLEIVLLFVGLVMGIFSFFCHKDYERLSIFFLPLAVLMTAQGFGILTTEVDGTLFIYILVAVLCGTGIANIYFPMECVETMQQPIPLLLQVQDLDAEDAPIQPLEVEQETVSDERPVQKEEYVQEENAIREEDMVVEEETVQEEESVQEEVAEQIQYIPNPLPLPKKHVPKVLDYDIEVADDDDYDI